MLHDLIDEKYLEGPQDWSSSIFDNFDWIVIGDEYTVKQQIIDDMVQWCLENCISKYSWGYKHVKLSCAEVGFIFQNMYDATAFKLRWL